jgi:hypothetical protein
MMCILWMRTRLRGAVSFLLRARDKVAKLETPWEAAAQAVNAEGEAPLDAGAGVTEIVERLIVIAEGQHKGCDRTRGGGAKAGA